MPESASTPRPRNDWTLGDEEDKRYHRDDPGVLAGPQDNSDDATFSDAGLSVSLGAIRLPAQASGHDSEARSPWDRAFPPVGSLLPPLRLRTTSGRLVDLRQAFSDSLVAFFPHPDGCEACRNYADALARSAEEYGDWGGAAVAVVHGAEDVGPATQVVSTVLDPEGDVRRRCHLAPSSATVLVSDRFGQVWQASTADQRHVLPAPDQIAETVRFIGIQCPECGVPDVPG